MSIRRVSQVSGVSSVLSCAVAVLTLGVSILACGSDGSTFDNGNGNRDGGSNPNDPEGVFGENPFGPGGTFAACASSNVDTRLAPANLVVMYDSSGSMGNPNEASAFRPELKWNPMATAMTDVFADKRSATMSASLQFFPKQSTGVRPANPSSPTDEEIRINNAAACGFDYATPAIEMRSLGDSGPFVQILGETVPQGGTPTLPALQGAISYAKTIAGQRPENEKTVVVLVTDGEPGMVVNSQPPPNNLGEGCPGNTVGGVAAAAAEAFNGTPSIRTYVVGVGSALTSLHDIAAKGGTERATIVEVGDPTKTKATFQGALEAIRTQNLTCDFAIPAPPSGETINFNQVNIVFERGDGKFQVLQYSSDCSDGNGWRYDNASAPTKVQLCQSVCTAVQSDAGGKLKLAFGCDTNGDLR